MSILPHIQKLIQTRKLFWVPSLLPGEKAERKMVITANVESVICPPFPETQLGVRHSDFRQTIDSFVTGEELSVSFIYNRKPPGTILAATNPLDSGFWQLRSTAVAPGMRLLGAFIEKDFFVGLSFNYREKMKPFDASVQDCAQVWEDLFQDYSPLKGHEISTYLTRGYNVQQAKQ